MVKCPYCGSEGESLWCGNTGSGISASMNALNVAEDSGGKLIQNGSIKGVPNH